MKVGVGDGAGVTVAVDCGLAVGDGAGVAAAVDCGLAAGEAGLPHADKTPTSNRMVNRWCVVFIIVFSMTSCT